MLFSYKLLCDTASDQHHTNCDLIYDRRNPAPAATSEEAGQASASGSRSHKRDTCVSHAGVYKYPRRYNTAHIDANRSYR